jgi:hypothetical protein
MVASLLRLLLSACSEVAQTGYSFLLVYLCAKFGALNPRINEIRSGENWLSPPFQVLTPRFSVPTIFWVSDLVAMFSRASGTIMDNNLHLSSHLYAINIDAWSDLKLILREENFIKEYVSLIRLLSTTFTVAVGRSQANIQRCI